jgi:hypothetical protein
MLSFYIYTGMLSFYIYTGMLSFYIYTGMLSFYIYTGMLSFYIYTGMLAFFLHHLSFWVLYLYFIIIQSKCFKYWILCSDWLILKSFMTKRLPKILLAFSNNWLYCICITIFCFTLFIFRLNFSLKSLCK